MSNIRITGIRRKPTDIHGLARALAALTLEIVKASKKQEKKENKEEEKTHV